MTATVTIDDHIVAALIQHGVGQTPAEAIKRSVEDYFLRLEKQADTCAFFAHESPFRENYTNEAIEAEELADAEHHLSQRT